MAGRNQQGKDKCPKCGAALAWTNGQFRCNPCGGMVVMNPAASFDQGDASKDELIARLEAGSRALAERVAEVEAKAREAARTGGAEIYRLQDEVKELQRQLAENQKPTDLSSTHPAAEELAAVRIRLLELATDGKITKADLLAEIEKLAGPQGEPQEQPPAA